MSTPLPTGYNHDENALTRNPRRNRHRQSRPRMTLPRHIAFICDNYNPGDEIILIGFSRGAFTARSVADMICNLGFLNRAGLDHLGDIFHDYSTWEEWADEKKFDPSKHLVGFCIENYDQVQRRNIAWKSQNAANLATDTSVQGEPPGSMKQRPKEAKSFQDSMLSGGGAKRAPEYAKDLEDKMYDGLLKQKQISLGDNQSS
ncbi:predicted protein [Verticillium alfalfae VaMs.102]|uniref:Predicted protein n=1 Tax=Verticillium alfalfae (strain VaMs.102 / ATCC MYA-4576 / FGSC 10136) TaxID=526221 RepID=C9SHJ1_VERA1|nr:predicted protein [Verticillium alfalfae VaMs.102]EEY18414.1 predicted protein [Verticillium alfalfae VaMs.102]